MTAHFRKIEIQQNQVWRSLFYLSRARHDSYAFGPVFGYLYFDVRVQFLKGLFQQTHVSRIVLDDQEVERPGSTGVGHVIAIEQRKAS